MVKPFFFSFTYLPNTLCFHKLGRKVIMKKHLLIDSFIALALAAFIAFAGSSKAGTASAERTSFQQVTSQLDPGGNFYLYLSTEQWLEGLSAKVGAWRKLVDAIPEVPDDQRENIGKAFDIVTNLIKDSGLEEISGFGMSSISTAKGEYRIKSVLHHYKGQGSGFLWSLCGEKPHALEGLNYLPASAALASFSDLNIPALWSVIQKEVRKSGFPEAQAFLDQFPQQFEQHVGLSWDKVLASLGGEFGFILTLDETRKISLPIPNNPLEIPEPGIILVARVKDDTIFNRVEEALKSMGQNIISTNTATAKMRTVPVPLPIPIQLRPTLASSGGYLFIASSDALVQEALDVKAGKKPGLKDGAEFKHLATGLPQQGNAFSFMSERLGKAITEIQKQALQAAPAQMEWLQSLVTAGKAPFAYSVGVNGEEGWVTTGNGNQHPAKMFLAAGVVPVAIMAGMALPALAKAKERAQKISCMNNLRQIELAKKQWALDKNKPDSATPTREDLRSALGKFPTCPSGGKYTINALSEKPECSHPGHSLD
jgi:hypothetical protein